MRISYIDTAKFFAIFFVLVGHADLTSNISALFYSFHVQMFFILYGYVHRRKIMGIKDLKRKYIKQFNRLMVPFFILFFLLGDPLTVKGIIKAMYGTTWIQYHPGSLHLWFLPCLFASSVIFEYLRSRKWLGGANLLVILFLLGIISAYANFDRDISINIGNRIIHFTYFTKDQIIHEYYIGFPYSLNIAFSGVIFMYLGVLLRYVENKYSLFDNNSRCASLFIISSILGYLSFMFNQTNLSSSLGFKVVSMGAAFYGNYILFITTSFLLSISTICIAKVLDNRIFSRVGKSTMEIYSFHMILLPIISLLFFKFHIPSFGGITNASVCLLLCCLAIPVIDYIIPSLKAHPDYRKDAK